MTQIFIPISVSVISPLDAWACQIVGHFFKAICPQYTENVNISWVWPLHTGSASWQTASCHQISGRNVISPILPSWPKPIIEYFRPITEILKRVRAVTLSLGPVSSLFWKFQSTLERAILKELRVVMSSGTDKRMDAMTDVNTRWSRWRPRVIKWQQYPSASISAGYISMPNFMIFLSRDLSANAVKPQNVVNKRTDGQWYP